jgi:hypothetical protein
MDPDDRTNRGSDTDDRIPDQRQPKDTDGVTKRTEAPTEPGDSGFDVDAPGNFVDDTRSADVPEPNEPA